MPIKLVGFTVQCASMVSAFSFPYQIQENTLCIAKVLFIGISHTQLSWKKCQWWPFMVSLTRILHYRTVSYLVCCHLCNNYRIINYNLLVLFAYWNMFNLHLVTFCFRVKIISQNLEFHEGHMIAMLREYSKMIVQEVSGKKYHFFVRDLIF